MGGMIVIISGSDAFVYKDQENTHPSFGIQAAITAEGKSLLTTTHTCQQTRPTIYVADREGTEKHLIGVNMTTTRFVLKPTIL